MGGGMINNLRTVSLKHLIYSSGIPYRTDNNSQIKLRIISLKLLLNCIGIVFIDIKNNKLLGAVRRYLTAKLRANRASSAGYKYCFAIYKFKASRHIHLYRVSAQKVFDGNILHIGDCHLVLDELIYSGKNLNLAGGLIADIYKITLLLCGCRRNCQKYLSYRILLDRLQYIVSAADDRNSFYKALPLICIVIYKAGNAQIILVPTLYIAQDRLSRLARTDYHNVFHISAV